MSNKRIKMAVLIFAFLAVASFVNAQVFTATNDPIADSAWEAKPIMKYPQTSYPFTNEDHVEMHTAHELHNRVLRTWAIDFWKKFPNDPRTHTALLEAMIKRAYYWKDSRSGSAQYIHHKWRRPIPVDTHALNNWNRLYPTLKKAYLNSPYVSEKDRLIFKKTEFNILLLSQKSWLGKKLPVQLALEAFEEAVIATGKLDSTNIYNKIGGTNVFTAAEAFFIFREKYGWDLDNDINLLLQLCTTSKVEEVRDWGLQRSALMKLKSKRFQLKHNDVNGKLVDLNDYKGKVVLIDIWATWCSGCISGMNGIKDIYEKLHPKGFEVISVSIDLESNREDVLKVRDKIGFTWSLLIAGGESWEDKTALYADIKSKYGFASVPQLLLFDKDGKLVEYKGPLLNREGLQQSVEKYLSK